MTQKLLPNLKDGWTLFIDRDGVVNEEKYQDYIHRWEEFHFFPGAKEAFKIFDSIFETIIMVTNQRGIAKGLTQIDDLEIIHQNMLREIQGVGGRIDRIYFCGEMESPNRKPNPGMGIQAMKDFPDIVLNKSIMIGNTLSDMHFGRNLGIAFNIYIDTTTEEIPSEGRLIDFTFKTLFEAADFIQSIQKNT